MPTHESEPLEVRKAYAIAELIQIVDQAATLAEAKELCKKKLIELVDQGVVRSADEDIEHIKATVRIKMENKFRAIEERTEAKKYFDFAEKLRKDGQNDIAVDFYQDAIELDPNEARYFNNLGISLTNLGRLEEADKLFLKALALDPTNRGLYHKNRGVIETRTKNAEKYFDIAHGLRMIGNYQEAIVQYNLAIELNSQDPKQYLFLGISYFNLKEYSKAVDAYQKAINIEPNNAFYYFYLGEALLELGRHGEAVAAFQKAVDLDPKNTLYVNSLSKVKGMRQFRRSDGTTYYY